MSGAGEIHDAIVIGAGHNGLAAAVHLAAKGWKVAVVERADEAGGAVKTREVTVPGFRHDLFAMKSEPVRGVQPLTIDRAARSRVCVGSGQRAGISARADMPAWADRSTAGGARDRHRARGTGLAPPRE